MASSAISKQFPNPFEQESFLSTLEFKSVLGVGGFGIVFETIDTSKPILIESAVKIIHLADSDPDIHKQVIRECSIAKELNHPNLVRLLNVEKKNCTQAEVKYVLQNAQQEDDRIFSTMAYFMSYTKRHKTIQLIFIQLELCGENLRKYLQSETTIQTTKISIIQNIVSGLKFLHNQNIIHRDLKPENIMFSKVGFILPVKIGDFGLARRLQEFPTGPLTTGVGTLLYMAPEVNKGDYDKRADIFSIGLIIWEVAQSLPIKEIHFIFDQLVYEKVETLVQDHPRMIGVKDLIINSTKRRQNERTYNIDAIFEITKKWNQNSLLVTTSRGFTSCIDNARRGCTITLAEGSFHGPFELDRNGVTIAGQGPSTILTSEKSTCLQIFSNGCSISDLFIGPGKSVQIEGSQNKLENISTAGGSISLIGDNNHLKFFNISATTLGISISGNNNMIEHIQLKDCNSGISITGNDNTIENIHLKDMHHGILLMNDSNRNLILDVHGENVVRGIQANGRQNNIKRAVFTKNDGGNFVAVCLKSGSEHTIERLTCTGYLKNKHDWGALIEAENCAMKFSSGPVHVLADRANLTNVKWGEILKLGIQSNNVILTNCSGGDSTTGIIPNTSTFEAFTHNTVNHQTCLGNGGYGIVLQAVDSSGLLIAVKYMFPMADKVKQREQMLRESNITDLPKHENIVHVMNFEQKLLTAQDIISIFTDEVLLHDEHRLRLRDGYFCKAGREGTVEVFRTQMELCGENLDKWLQQGLDPTDSQVQHLQLRIIHDIVKGLKFLHDNKIIHRDLKPHNIMFLKDGFVLPVKIGDFGLCRYVHSEESQTGDMTRGVGTNPYYAPEVRAGKQYSKQADLFSLGLVIWQVAGYTRNITNFEECGIQEHPLVVGMKEMIVRLTKKEEMQRMQTIDDVEKYVKLWQEKLEQ